jgi:hypothetical protein
MGWARIDDGFDDHPKILSLLENDDGVTAVGLWLLCLTWAHRNTRKAGKVPGLIPSSLPRRYFGPGARDLAKLLVAEDLWDERAEGDGWMIHDFDRYLPTNETREARAEAGRRGAQKRWGNRRSDSNLPQSDSDLPSAGHELDSNAVANDGSRTPAHRAIPKGIAPIPTPGESSANEDDAETEGGDFEQERETLTAEVRKIRPDWSTTSIQRALAADAVNERPWPLVAAAALVMARDPESKHPGRLAHDGPWWGTGPPSAPAPSPKPKWCGHCDESTRLLGEDSPGRCPACHPFRESA